MVTESLSAARLLIPSASLSWDCLICTISVYIALETAVLQCAGFCSYNRLLQCGWENYLCKVSQMTLKHHKNWQLFFPVQKVVKVSYSASDVCLPTGISGSIFWLCTSLLRLCDEKASDVRATDGACMQKILNKFSMSNSEAWYWISFKYSAGFAVYSYLQYTLLYLWQLPIFFLIASDTLSGRVITSSPKCHLDIKAAKPALWILKRSPLFLYLNLYNSYCLSRRGFCPPL